MDNNKAKALKSSQGISLPKNKRNKDQNKRLFDILEAAKILAINEMTFRSFLAQYILEGSGMPKNSFLNKGYFLTYSTKLELPNGSISLKKVKITKKGLDFLRWFCSIKKNFKQ